jgi:hypothetical protein
MSEPGQVPLRAAVAPRTELGAPTIADKDLPDVHRRIEDHLLYGRVDFQLAICSARATLLSLSPACSADWNISR